MAKKSPRIEKRCLVYIAEGRMTVEYEGNWSRYELDRAYRAMMNELPKHKRELVRQFEKQQAKNEGEKK